MTSTTITRWWLSAVLCSRSRHSVAKATAVSKPKVVKVLSRSLSMVLGTPTTRRPFWCSALAMVSEPSPPMDTSASSSFIAKYCRISPERSTSLVLPSGIFIGKCSGLPRFVVPRMVPPRWEMPRTRSLVRRNTPPSG